MLNVGNLKNMKIKKEIFEYINALIKNINH